MNQKTAALFVTCDLLMIDNKLVDFFASYGPKPSANNLYDEFVMEAAKETGCTPIQIEQPLTQELVSLFRSSSPKSVVLTGTAGDGKTYTARKVAETLFGEHGVWSNTEKIFEQHLSTTPSRRISFIKDLSELNASDKKSIYPKIAASFSGQSDEVFLICVNDGHLINYFRGKEDNALHKKIAYMLKNDLREDEGGNFELINLSRQSHQKLLDQIVDGIVEHREWASCNGCPALTNKHNTCPIQCNREILRKKDPASMRSRLKDIIRMSAADGRHLSIRQNILLTVNILLGDAKKQGEVLLSCTKARNRAKNNDYEFTNPYANVFGENLTERERQQYGVFRVLSEFQIGFETNNFFDQALLNEDASLPSCQFYGERVFASKRKEYLENPADHVEDFRKAMIDQRRRLFFSIYSEDRGISPSPRKNIWNLSIYKHGSKYIEMVDAFLNGQYSALRPIRRLLLRGLNRMMTGELTTTDDRLWLTAPSGVFLGQGIPLLIQRAGPTKIDSASFISIELPNSDSGSVDDGKPPYLFFKSPSKDFHPVKLPLRPTLIECLLRIAEGALSASFSSECQREVELFQLRVKALKCKVSPMEIGLNGGELQDSSIEILMENDDW